MRSKETERILELQRTETPAESIARRQLVRVSKPSMLMGKKAQVSWAATGSVGPADAEAFGQAVLEAVQQARGMDAASAGLGIPPDKPRSVEGLVVARKPRKQGAQVNWGSIGGVGAEEAEAFGQAVIAAAARAREMDAAGIEV